jgi:hypothetical protein
MFIHRFVRFSLICLVSITVLSCEKKAEDCIDEVAKNAKTESGVAIGVANCRTNTNETNQKENKNLTDENKVVKSIDEVSSKCYVFWDGRHWQNGKTEGDNFLRFKIGKYGVEVMVIALPVEMATEFGISKDSPDQVDIKEGAFGAFMKEHWYQLDTLCNLS